MRLNSIMALITVVCVIGVVSGELIGPVAQLRYGRRDEDDAAGSGKALALRAELADNAFQFASSEQPLMMEVLGPKLDLGRGQRRTYLWPDFSPVSMLWDNPAGGEGDTVPLGGAEGAPGGLSGSDGLTAASFTTSFSPFSPQQSSAFNSGPVGPGGGAPPPPGPPPPPPPPLPSAAPEPGSWLLLILGLGGAGLALRRRQAEVGRSPGETEPEHLRS